MREGEIVRSLAGRDEGKVFIVVKKVDESYVLIADGKAHPIDKPKKKKNKHLCSLGLIEQNDQNPLPVTNGELRRALARTMKLSEECIHG